ncbi:MAG: chromosome segregation and condensation protein ScpB [Frankiales bacterium]|nr:chromosome segregation and condensation protein ScpB [Frankiales bacterium]MCW2666436.1 chromosome segregation and condensation protein ScpB [Frankiales bacterium]
MTEVPPLPAVLEALLLVTDEPVSAVLLAQIAETTSEQVTEALHALAQEYDARQRGFELREVAGGWRLYTRAELAPYVERYVLDGQQARLTQAALETLAVVAYRQPVTRSRISAVRGVNVDGVVRTLLARGLIVEAGNDPEHGATRYRTTALMLERLGLRSLDELPSLAPFLPDLDDLEDADSP